MIIRSSEPLAQELISCIRSGDTASLRRLLEDNPALPVVRIIDPKNVGRTLLHIATDWPGHFPNGPEIIRILISPGVDPNAAVTGVDTHRETALHGAASSGDTAAIDALLDGGADIEAPGAIFTGGTAMSDAVIFAQWNAARRLHQRGARTTFSQAAGLGLLDRVAIFFDQTPAPTLEEMTMALWHACRGGQLETVQFLIEKGADRNWVGWDRIAPLDGAMQSGNAVLVQWLREQGARPAAELRA